MPHTMDDPRIQEGLDIATLMWQELAYKIIEKAIRIYGLDEEQACALKDIFYKPNEYIVEIDEN